jgi:hypothetical protein
MSEISDRIRFQDSLSIRKKNDKANSLIKRLDDRSINELNDRNKHMHQTVLTSKKVDSRIMQKLNDTEEDFELSLFDKIKLANQKNSICVAIRDVIRNKKKYFDEMLLKKFESIENTLFFKRKL